MAAAPAPQLHTRDRGQGGPSGAGGCTRPGCPWAGRLGVRMCCQSINQSITFKVHGEPAGVSWDCAEGLDGCNRLACSRRVSVLPPPFQDSLPLVCITSYEMMQRLTCDACKGRGVQQQASMCAGQRPPCRDPHHCMACLQWRVVVVDGERQRGGVGGRVSHGWLSQERVFGAAPCPQEARLQMVPRLLDLRPPPLCRLVSPPPPAESHTLRTSSKPPDALHTEAVVSAVKAARRAILLTGTPSLSRPFDLFRQVRGCASRSS